MDILTVCVDYADFLQVTLPEAMKYGNVTVATSPHDIQTIELCNALGANVVITGAWYKDDAPFNKGAGMNAALEALKPQGWLLSMDADIVLTPQPAGATPVALLDTDCMYGARRRECEQMSRWERCLRQRDYFHLRMSPLPPVYGKKGKGRVWGSRPTSNPVGIQGYFQLWHYASHPFKMHEHRTAAKYDVELGLKFPDHRRMLVPWPNYTVLHLGIRKTNWKGRKTEAWDTCGIPPGDLEKAAKIYYA
jgi:hypothetical protein